MRLQAFVIPGRRRRSREARPDATNPESSNLVWIPGSLASGRAPE
jgi:hypothetical protein